MCFSAEVTKRHHISPDFQILDLNATKQLPPNLRYKLKYIMAKFRDNSNNNNYSHCRYYNNNNIITITSYYHSGIKLLHRRKIKVIKQRDMRLVWEQIQNYSYFCLPIDCDGDLLLLGFENFLPNPNSFDDLLD